MDFKADEKRGFSQAKLVAFRYLKVRERSVGEMREKLTLKKIDKVVIEKVIEYLLEKKFLDDAAFTRNWIRYRQARPFGPQRIRLELKQKGLDQEIIEQEMRAAFEQHDQWSDVLEMARRRAGRYQNEEPIKRKKKVFDFLARRGFSLDMIKKAVNNI